MKVAQDFFVEQAKDKVNHPSSSVLIGSRRGECGGGSARFNSPWNIAVKFRIDMSFSVPDIEAMLAEYREDNSLDFDMEEIAAEIRKLTSGYPYLVSGICQIIDENLHRD